MKNTMYLLTILLITLAFCFTMMTLPLHAWAMAAAFTVYACVVGGLYPVLRDYNSKQNGHENSFR